MLINIIIINHMIFFSFEDDGTQIKAIIYVLPPTFNFCKIQRIKKVSKWETSETSEYRQFQSCSNFVILKDNLRSWTGSKKVQEGTLWQTRNLVLSVVQVFRIVRQSQLLCQTKVFNTVVNLIYILHALSFTFYKTSNSLKKQRELKNSKILLRQTKNKNKTSHNIMYFVCFKWHHDLTDCTLDDLLIRSSRTHFAFHLYWGDRERCPLLEDPRRIPHLYHMTISPTIF